MFGYVQKKQWAKLAFISCIIACTGDLAITFILPAFYPGFNPVFQTISAMGIASSPVGRIVSDLWIVLGIVFLVVGFTYFKSAGKHSAEKIAALLIALYGLCDVIGSGAFPGTFTHGKMTATQTMHNVLGSIGTFAIIMTPVILMTSANIRKSKPFFNYMIMTTVIGILMWGLFITGRSLNPVNLVFRLHGLWQRIFIVNYYIFLVVLTFRNLIQKTITVQPLQPAHSGFRL